MLFVAWLAAPALAPLSWDEARAEASTLVALMTADEKASLMLGTGWHLGVLTKYYYVGNIPGVERLGIPRMNMMDAAGGFRTYWSELVGTVTCWPSLLSLASTWDPDVVLSFATALGKEFAGKGANTILGPSINVHRVARNGRNFEYLSGEDPYLGSQLVGPYVQGVTASGVMSVTKHWVLNHQETNRNSESSNVDDATLWQLYYPPYEAAVAAGTSGFMCSYNKVNGTYSCSTQATLTKDLKGTMGFRGFVQSDWGATHDVTLQDGLDQEMPMAPNAMLDPAAPYYFSPAKLAQQPSAAVDEAATRLVTTMARLRLLNRSYCAPPCEAQLRANVTSGAHAALARAAATAAIVLLQNKGDVLPLDATKVRSIAVIGEAAAAGAYDPAGTSQGQGGWHQGDYYSGGGSGHVTAGYVISPLAGIAARAATAGIRVVSCTNCTTAASVAMAKGVDVAIVVGGTTSGESVDRPNLTLDHGADALISAVAAANGQTVALVAAPGAFLTPWRGAVAASAALFLGGQESGAAWATVLFGDAPPAGRLPLTLAGDDAAHTITLPGDDAAHTIDPSEDAAIAYSEGLATGYRAPGATAAAAFPFGHGLTYTTFAFGAPTVDASACSPAAAAKKAAAASSGTTAAANAATAAATTATAAAAAAAGGCSLCVSLPVRNTGGVAAAAVPQLYLDVPAAGWPAPLLRGFKKTAPIAPGASVAVPFCLATRDLSYYAHGGWVKAAMATAHFGASAGDLRQSLVLPLGAVAPVPLVESA